MANSTQIQLDPSAELRSAGLRVTASRIAVLSILEASDPHHVSAEDVYRALLDRGTDIGLATIYRVLTQLEAAGFVTRHHFDGGQALFELDNGDDHDHIVCTRTGRVSEFKDRRIEKRLAAIARDLGYELTDHQIILRGIYTHDEKPDTSKPVSAGRKRLTAGEKR